MILKTFRSYQILCTIPTTEDFSDVFLMMRFGVYLGSKTPKVKAFLPIKDIDQQYDSITVGVFSTRLQQYAVFLHFKVREMWGRLSLHWQLIHKQKVRFHTLKNLKFLWIENLLILFLFIIISNSFHQYECMDIYCVQWVIIQYCYVCFCCSNSYFGHWNPLGSGVGW